MRRLTLLALLVVLPVGARAQWMPQGQFLSEWSSAGEIMVGVDRLESQFMYYGMVEEFWPQVTAVVSVFVFDGGFHHPTYRVVHTMMRYAQNVLSEPMYGRFVATVPWREIAQPFLKPGVLWISVDVCLYGEAVLIDGTVRGGTLLAQSNPHILRPE